MSVVKKLLIKALTVFTSLMMIVSLGSNVYAIETTSDPDSDKTTDVTETSKEEDIAQDTNEEPSVVSLDEKSNDVVYQAHVAKYGWLKAVKNNAIAGTVGKSKAIEALKISLSNPNLGLEAYTYSMNRGWKTGLTEKKTLGTTGISEGIETISLKLTGVDSDKYDIYYRVHVSSIGWLAYAKNGEKAGCSYNKKIEAIRIKIVSKDETGPTTGKAYATKKDNSDPHLEYQSHQQKYGWENIVTDKITSGKTGKSLRLEAFRMKVISNKNIQVKYRAHVQGIGWQKYFGDGFISGTTNRSKRIEAVTMELTGSDAAEYKLYYRLHLQSIGWTGWATSGEDCGSQGKGIRVEAMEAVIIPKDDEAPGSTDNHWIKSPTLTYAVEIQGLGWQTDSSENEIAGSIGKKQPVTLIKSSLDSESIAGNIQYQPYIASVGWSTWKSNGEIAGDSDHHLEAMKIELTGTMSKLYNVYYRVHTSHFGWLGWTKNGQQAGTKGYNYAIEAIQIKLQPKNSGIQQATGNAFKDKNNKRQAMLDRLKSIASNRDLLGCFNWVVNHTTYRRTSAVPNYHDWDIDWVNNYLNSRSGNQYFGHCYSYAAVFANLARLKGYNAVLHVGKCRAIGGGLTNHGWVEIDGKVYDPDMADAKNNVSKYYGKTRSQIGLGYCNDVVY